MTTRRIKRHKARARKAIVDPSPTWGLGRVSPIAMFNRAARALGWDKRMRSVGGKGVVVNVWTLRGQP